MKSFLTIAIVILLTATHALASFESVKMSSGNERHAAHQISVTHLSMEDSLSDELVDCCEGVIHLNHSHHAHCSIDCKAVGNHIHISGFSFEKLNWNPFSDILTSTVEIDFFRPPIS